MSLFLFNHQLSHASIFNIDANNKLADHFDRVQGGLGTDFQKKEKKRKKLSKLMSIFLFMAVLVLHSQAWLG